MNHPDSLKRHIDHLEDHHQLLEKQLVILEQQHQNDTPVALTMKKRKLFLKDELVRCRHTLAEML
jgi:uncharacterized protein YdcH (DUF465 family)